MVTAEKGAILLQSVAEDPDTTMVAGRRQSMDRTLEAVEDMRFPVHGDLKCLVVVVTAGLTYCHDNTFSYQAA